MLPNVFKSRSCPSLGNLARISGAAALAFVLLATLAACSRPAPETTGDEGLIWETWQVINESYVDVESVDSEKVSESVIAAMLAQVEEPAYPFLTELDATRGRVPGGVPVELLNVWKAWEALHLKYPELDRHALAVASVQGMVEGLSDVSTRYLTPEAYDRALEETDDDYEGIGAFVNVVNGQVTLSPMRGGPADVGGIRAGDVLIEVEGQSMDDLTADEAVSLVRGPARSKVHLKVSRPDEERPLEFDITRGTIEVPTVDVQLLPGAIGYVYVSEFTDNTPNEVLDVVERLKAADMLALILDLRSNPGGPVESARKVAGEFLPEGTFMYEMDSQGNRIEYLVEGEGTIAGEDEVPMAVLANKATADASEALAGALQDASRATVIGTETNGDAAGFSYFPLGDGSAVQLAVTRWHTPMGKLISDGGISPDIQVPLLVGTSGDAQLVRAYDHLNEQLPLFR